MHVRPSMAPLSGVLVTSASVKVILLDMQTKSLIVDLTAPASW